MGGFFFIMEKNLLNQKKNKHEVPTKNHFQTFSVECNKNDSYRKCMLSRGFAKNASSHSFLQMEPNMI